MKRAKLKRPITLACTSVIHDRRASDLTIKAMVTPVEVVDPFGDRVVAFRSLRDDPLAGMIARKQIDQAQFDAGRKWQAFSEDTEVGNIRAIDPSKEAVDGGRMPEPLSDRAAYAFKQLARANLALGDRGVTLVQDVLGGRLSITEAANRRGYSSKDELAFMGRRFREALDTLAVVFGCATGGR